MGSNLVPRGRGAHSGVDLIRPDVEIGNRFVERSDERSRNAAGGIVAAYLSWHLERGLRSLVHVDRG